MGCGALKTSRLADPVIGRRGGGPQGESCKLIATGITLDISSYAKRDVFQPPAPPQYFNPVVPQQ